LIYILAEHLLRKAFLGIDAFLKEGTDLIFRGSALI